STTTLPADTDDADGASPKKGIKRPRSAIAGSTTMPSTHAMSDQKENVVPSEATKDTRSMLEMHPQHRFIRFGENEHDVFLVKPEDTARMQLLEKLKNDPMSPEKWLALLQHPPSYNAKLYSVLRLYRRATTFIPKEQFRHNRSYAEIWIAYAKLITNEKDTRGTFKYMKTERIGEREPKFYEEYAAFELEHGNANETDEILALGLAHGAYNAVEQEQIKQRLINRSVHGTPRAPTSSVLQTPREAKESVVNAFSRSISTPASTSALHHHTMQTPTQYSSFNSSGFSTASKMSAYESKVALSTPSMATRPAAKAQTTSRKNRIFKLGAPLRVIASTKPDDQQSALDNDDDDDDDMMGIPHQPEKAVHASTGRKLSPIGVGNPLRSSHRNVLSLTANERSVTQPDPAADLTQPPTRKLEPTELDYIKRWNPRPVGSTQLPTTASTEIQKAAPVSHAEERRGPSVRFAVPPPDDRFGDHADLRGLKTDLSPISSASSSSSSSSPFLGQPTSQDPFTALSNRVTVNGLTYIKLEQIGSGGSSKVYRMLGPDLKIYALKKIKLKRLDRASIEQYNNEIDLLKRLQGNPHIIKLISAEPDLQRRLIHVVMEHGEIDLSDKLRELKDNLDENFLRVIWTQMLQAVHAIHSERIIHGDLKPANFLFVNGALKLIDFGIAKAISNDTTNIERDSQVGTVNFMSPEAIQGNNGNRNLGKMKVWGLIHFEGIDTKNPRLTQVGRASDIWSLGCILYQIVYGRPPFADVHSIIEKFRCIIDESYAIPFPSLRNKHLEHVIRSCLQRDHRLRPTIDGEDGLLNHPFLRSESGSGNGSPNNGGPPVITSSNASSALQQLAELLRDRGMDSTQVARFVSIGHQGLEARPGYSGRFPGEERRPNL
ncbi:TPA: hypothetical protein N0F65_007819, partial [Lagenidium giganteum]